MLKCIALPAYTRVYAENEVLYVGKLMELVLIYWTF